MPYGRWPERVKDFRKWSNQHIDKAKITDSVTGSRTSSKGRRRRKRRKKRKEE